MAEHRKIKHIEDERQELLELDALLMRLPDEIVQAYSRQLGNGGPAQFRSRMGAVLKAMLTLVEVVEDLPVGRHRAHVLNALEAWRDQRARVAARIGKIDEIGPFDAPAIGPFDGKPRTR
jgi:hypothetical protein